MPEPIFHQEALRTLNSLIPEDMLTFDFISEFHQDPSDSNLLRVISERMIYHFAKGEIRKRKVDPVISPFLFELSRLGVKVHDYHDPDQHIFYCEIEISSLSTIVLLSEAEIKAFKDRANTQCLSYTAERMTEKLAFAARLYHDLQLTGKAFGPHPFETEIQKKIDTINYQIMIMADIGERFKPWRTIEGVDNLVAQSYEFKELVGQYFSDLAQAREVHKHYTPDLTSFIKLCKTQALTAQQNLEFSDNEFLCTISKSLCTIPVLINGRLYDLKSIEALPHFAETTTLEDPCTRGRVHRDQIQPARELWDKIQARTKPREISLEAKVARDNTLSLLNDLQEFALAPLPTSAGSIRLFSYPLKVQASVLTFAKELGNLRDELNIDNRENIDDRLINLTDTFLAKQLAFYPPLFDQLWNFLEERGFDSSKNLFDQEVQKAFQCQGEKPKLSAQPG